MARLDDVTPIVRCRDARSGNLVLLAPELDMKFSWVAGATRRSDIELEVFAARRIGHVLAMVVDRA